jgi:methylated-DNA-protein-cysteine methyltransferase-like protein
MNEYQRSILTIVRSIPQGKVMSYGQVAAYIGRPKEAREVGWAMQKIEADFPWWRVLNNVGLISIKDNPDADAAMQRQLLEKEGIIVDNNLKLDMDIYRFYLDETALKNLYLDPMQIESILLKYQPQNADKSVQLSLF